MPAGGVSVITFTVTFVVDVFGTPGDVQTALTIELLGIGQEAFVIEVRLGVTTAVLTARLTALFNEFLRYHALENSAIKKNIIRSTSSIITVSMTVCPWVLVFKPPPIR